MQRPRRRPVTTLLLAVVAALAASAVAAPAASAKELPDFQPATLEVAPPGIDLPLGSVTDTAYDQERHRLFIAGYTRDADGSVDVSTLVYDDRTGSLSLLEGADTGSELVLDLPAAQLITYDDDGGRIDLISLETLQVEDSLQVAHPCSDAASVRSMLLCGGGSAIDLVDGEVVDEIAMIGSDGQQMPDYSTSMAVADPRPGGTVYAFSYESPGFLYRARADRDESGTPVLRQLDRRPWTHGFQDVDVSPDGLSLFISGIGFRVRQLATEDLTTTRILNTFQHFVDVAVSPEGRVVAGTSSPYAPQVLLYGEGRTQTTQAWWIDPEDSYTTTGTDYLETPTLQMARDQIFAVTHERYRAAPELRIIPTRRPTVVTLRASDDYILSGSRVRLTARLSPPQAGREVSINAPGYRRHVFETDRRGRVTTMVQVKGDGNRFIATVRHTDQREGSRAVKTVEAYRIPD